MVDYRDYRHPEKRNRPDMLSPKKPSWIRVRAPQSGGYSRTREVVRKHNLRTVCEEASCPNMGECWSRSHASFIIMGDICTRSCSFCNVATGKPVDLDIFEPFNVAKSVFEMGLRHVVITSVDRDDLEDGGARHFAETINAVREKNPETTIEVLTPDFRDKEGALELVLEARPDVFNHNIETVPRLYPRIRSGARYFWSLYLLRRAKELYPSIFTKSGLMLGLGEEDEEIYQVMDDLRVAEVDFLTMGQYLQPTRKHAVIDRYVSPENFDRLGQVARGKGFLQVSSSPLTRSSYHADDDFAELRAKREVLLGKMG